MCVEGEEEREREEERKRQSSVELLTGRLLSFKSSQKLSIAKDTVATRAFLNFVYSVAMRWSLNCIVGS